MLRLADVVCSEFWRAWPHSSVCCGVIDDIECRDDLLSAVDTQDNRPKSANRRLTDGVLPGVDTGGISKSSHSFE